MSRLLTLLLLLIALPLQATTLKIATLAPDGSYWMQELRRSADKLKQQSQGRISLRFYPGGVMGNDQSVLRKMRIGQMHGAVLTAGGIALVSPESQIYSLPFLFRNYDEVDQVRAEMDRLLLKGLEQHRLVSYGISEIGFAYLMSKNPVSDIETLRAQKVWAPQGDQLSRGAFKAVGVTPVPLPLGDVLTGLETGLIDTVGTSPLGAIALQWHSRIRYLTDIPLLYLYGALVFDQRAVSRLRPADRELLARVMAVTAGRIGRQSRRDNQSAREALAQQGITFITPDTGQLEQWRDSMNKAVDRLVAQGQIDPAQLSQLRELLAALRRQQKQ